MIVVVDWKNLYDLKGFSNLMFANTIFFIVSFFFVPYIVFILLLGICIEIYFSSRFVFALLSFEQRNMRAVCAFREIYPAWWNQMYSRPLSECTFFIVVYFTSAAYDRIGWSGSCWISLTTWSTWQNILEWREQNERKKDSRSKKIEKAKLKHFRSNGFIHSYLFERGALLIKQ